MLSREPRIASSWPACEVQTEPRMRGLPRRQRKPQPQSCSSRSALPQARSPTRREKRIPILISLITSLLRGYRQGLLQRNREPMGPTRSLRACDLVYFSQCSPSFFPEPLVLVIQVGLNRALCFYGPQLAQGEYCVTCQLLVSKAVE